MIDIDYGLLRGIDYKLHLRSKDISTFRAGGEIALALFPRTRLDLEVVASLPHDGMTILGNMSNVCVREGGYNGIAVMTNRLTGLEVIGDRAYVGAGEKLSKVALRLSKLGYSGLERLVGIPASIGGAIYQNAGAFGQEIGDSIEEVLVYDVRQGETYRLNRQELGLAYRKSNLSSDRELIVGGVLRLKPNTDAYKESLRYVKKRRELQPCEPSLGSTFLKTEDGVGAGYYVDRCGYKGYTLDGVAVSTKHANFLVNCGGGTVSALERLKNIVKEGVYNKLGVTLREEIRIIGADENCRDSQKGRSCPPQGVRL